MVASEGTKREKKMQATQKEKRLFKMRLGKASFGEKREKKNIYQYPCRTKTYLKKTTKKKDLLLQVTGFLRVGRNVL